jgi:hypothetical protein
MVNFKITELDANTTPIGTDIIPIVDDPGGSPTTQKITLASLGIIDGWIPASESWAYASASTITVPSGAALKYKKGDKIKLTQQSVVKYFYIVSVADTVLTIVGGTTSSLVAEPITSNYYSHKENPIGFPDIFTYTVALTNITIGSGVIDGIFKIIGNLCHVWIYLIWAADTSCSGNQTFSIPITTLNNSELSVGTAWMIDGGSAVGYIGVVPTAASSNLVIPRYNQAAGYSPITNAVPFTWANTDSLNIQMIIPF